MNLTMVEHQRSILAVLGIDVWVPKTDVSIHSYAPSIYRDQAEPELSSEIGFIDTFVPTVVEQPPAQNSSAVKTTASANLAELEASLAFKKVVPELQTTTEQESKRDAAVESSPILIEPFVLHAISTPNYVIALNATQLNEAEISLWKNIQHAAVGQYQELKWPFALSQFQDGRGAKVYMQGFLDALCVDKKLICLGALPLQQESTKAQSTSVDAVNAVIQFGQATQLVQVATLQEMIDEPQLKRTLWQHMRSV